MTQRWNALRTLAVVLLALACNWLIDTYTDASMWLRWGITLVVIVIATFIAEGIRRRIDRKRAGLPDER
ncbi:MAG TPA: hypothetical protein VGP24_14365 [Glaciihabitans sp.]|jgi:hypothetical protein|nr:hypothetical protein [Glaciihabitans sp.]